MLVNGQASSVTHCHHKTKLRCLVRVVPLFLPSENNCEKGEIHNFTYNTKLHFNTTLVNGYWLLNISLEIIWRRENDHNNTDFSQIWNSQISKAYRNDKGKVFPLNSLVPNRRERSIVFIGPKWDSLLTVDMSEWNSSHALDHPNSFPRKPHACTPYCALARLSSLCLFWHTILLWNLLLLKEIQCLQYTGNLDSCFTIYFFPR